MKKFFSKKFYSAVSLLIIFGTYLININALDTFSKKFSEAVFWITVPIFVFSLTILFLKKESIFKFWTKFTNYFFIISLVLLLITPTSTHGLDFLPLVKETVSILLAVLYSIVSLILIIYKSLKKE